jgi:hypothetical protein
VAVKDKTWALNQLRRKRNATCYTLAAMRLLNSPSILSLRDRLVLLRVDQLIFRGHMQEVYYRAAQNEKFSWLKCRASDL